MAIKQIPTISSERFTKDRGGIWHRWVGLYYATTYRKINKISLTTNVPKHFEGINIDRIYASLNSLIEISAFGQPVSNMGLKSKWETISISSIKESPLGTIR